jgi:hypothetical protein
MSTHNYAQGLAAYLTYLEAFHASCGAGAGKYTSSGVAFGLGPINVSEELGRRTDSQSGSGVKWFHEQ